MSAINSKLEKHQQAKIKEKISAFGGFDFYTLLSDSWIKQTVESLQGEHRERVFTPTKTLSMFISQALNEDGSCQRVVNEAIVSQLVRGDSPISCRTGGYCRARKRLQLDLISTLAQGLACKLSCRVPDQWLWNGRSVKMVDGTTVSMPDTIENQKVYPQQGGQQEGLGFPISRIVGVFCLSSGAILNAAIGRFNGKGGDEQTLLRSIIDTFSTEDVVLGDAFFGTYFLLSELQRRGVDAVFEQMGARKRTTDFRKGQHLGQRDHIVELTKPKLRPYWMSEEEYESKPETLRIRELAVSGKVLITTMLDAKKYPKSEIKALYKRRWNVELDLRNIKTTMGMELFRCKTPDMVEKEMWVYFLAYNLIRLLVSQAALLFGLHPREISHKNSLSFWLSWRQTSGHRSEKMLLALFGKIAQQRVGQRPGRIEPRAIKRRPKPMPLLTKPREQARAEIREHGHPRKLK